MLFVLDIMQVTFVIEPIVDLPTNLFKRFNSLGMGTQLAFETKKEQEKEKKKTGYYHWQ